MSDDTNNQPLFQNMDEQERIYAPQQIPGDHIPADERDGGEDVGESAARADRTDDAIPAAAILPGAGGITGSSGGAAGPAGTIGPGVVPIVPLDDDLDDDRRERREND